MKLRLYKIGKGLGWTWDIVAANGKVLATASQNYSTRRKAKHTAWKVWHDFTAGLVRVEEL